MNLIRLAIERPIAVVAMTLMIVLFGVIAMRAIPVQLAPDVDRPVINVSTFWPGGAPAELERPRRQRTRRTSSGRRPSLRRPEIARKSRQSIAEGGTATAMNSTRTSDPESNCSDVANKR